MNRLFFLIFLFSPILVLSQDKIWEKSENEVSELIIGDWKVVRWTFESKEKPIKPNYFIESIYIKNDTLKLTEIELLNGRRNVIESDITAEIDKIDSGTFLCIDYDYKIYCREIMYINKEKLILEDGPNVFTYKKVNY